MSFDYKERSVDSSLVQRAWHLRFEGDGCLTATAESSWGCHDASFRVLARDSASLVSSLETRSTTRSSIINVSKCGEKTLFVLACVHNVYLSRLSLFKKLHHFWRFS
jgi:hypothetical protein